MTREEAKRRVECCRDFLANNYSDMGEPNFTALNMAIEALSEPTKTITDICGKCINNDCVFAGKGETVITVECSGYKPKTEPTKTDAKSGAIDKGKVLDILIKHDNEICSDTFDEMWKEVDALPFIEPTIITENMTNGDVIKAMFPHMGERARVNEYYLNKYEDNLTYIHIDGDWFNRPYKGNFTMPTRPKAKWIRHGACNYTCSECGFPVNQKYDFCICGAEMESE